MDHLLRRARSQLLGGAEYLSRRIHLVDVLVVVLVWYLFRGAWLWGSPAAAIAAVAPAAVPVGSFAAAEPLVADYSTSTWSPTAMINSIENCLKLYENDDQHSGYLAECVTVAMEPYQKGVGGGDTIVSA